MAGYIVGRVLQAIPVLFLASIAVFLVLRLVPGDPATRLAGQDATPAQVQQIRKELGLTDPLPVQYGRWLDDLAHGNLGTSLSSGLPVSHLLALSFPPTLELAVASYIIALLIGIPLGVLAGARPRGAWDWVLSVYSVFALGVPHFMSGILLLLVFTVWLHWLPVGGQVAFTNSPLESIKYLALPSLALGAGVAAVLARYTRTALADVMDMDFIRTARAKGLEPRVVVIRHALRNALVPVITISALQIGGLLAGAIVIEQVFTRPGLGRLIINAINTRDYLVIQSTLVIFVAIFVVVNLLADIAYGLADPRVRRS
ncbi:MAG TPA: ABC transporter permease [Tepidiformaceae bacterium]|nr:ABC transporter permease [Tepidiformaceae bacterium]